MKTIDITKLAKQEQQEAVNEVKVLSSLKHPYIVQYHESFIENGTLAIVMDYAEGGDLSKRIAHHRSRRDLFAEGQIIRWFTQIALGLKYLHKRHILHRDLKPQNIFLTKRDDLRLGDFGISVVGSTSVKEETTIGTPYYLSPEICHEKLYSFASDIWALGCILYELAALHVPFEATNIPGLIRKITSGKLPSLPPAFSADLRQLIHDILCQDYNRRPSVIDILQRSMIQSEMRQMLLDAPTKADSSTSPPLSRGSLTKPLETAERRALGSRPFLKPLEANVELKRCPSAPCDSPAGRNNALRQTGSNALNSSNGAVKTAWGEKLPKESAIQGKLNFKSPSEPSLLVPGDVFNKGPSFPCEKLSGAFGCDKIDSNLDFKRRCATPLLARGEALQRNRAFACDKLSEPFSCEKLRDNFIPKRACASPLLGMGAPRCGVTRGRGARRRPALPNWQDIH
jgi:NIMA (never in mitosis gene a)-related kinase